MSGKRKADSVAEVSDTATVDCVLDIPMGYHVLRPNDGRSWDQAVLDALKSLGAQRGEHVVVTFARGGSRAEK